MDGKYVLQGREGVTGILNDDFFCRNDWTEHVCVLKSKIARDCEVQWCSRSTNMPLIWRKSMLGYEGRCFEPSHDSKI